MSSSKIHEVAKTYAKHTELYMAERYRFHTVNEMAFEIKVALKWKREAKWFTNF